jgi:hypothetical protein
MIRIIPLILYIFLGLISLLMAFKNLFSKQFLPFQEAVYGKKWEEVDPGLQLVITALMRGSGPGFLVVALLLLSAPVANYFKPDAFLQFFIPSILLIFCAGLFIFNYILYLRAKVRTPWKNSILAIFVIVICIVFSSLG